MLKVKNNLWHSFCPLCTSSSLVKVGTINYFSPIYYSTNLISISLEPEFWRCSSCDSGFVQNAIPESESKNLYTQGNAGERWTTSLSFEQSKTQETIRLIETLLKKGMHVLDIGCNTGELLDFARVRGCNTYGIEYSQSSIKTLESKGHKAYNNLHEIEHHFDMITAFDLVEHLYDVPGFLNACFNKLKPNGYLIILTGSINCAWAKILGSNWWYMRYPEHVIFPSQKYFQEHPSFEISDWIKTYASPGYKNLNLTAIKGLVKSILRRNYCGLPSMLSDHVLIVLRPKLSIL